jgi:hypothetical protein
MQEDVVATGRHAALTERVLAAGVEHLADPHLALYHAAGWR